MDRIGFFDTDSGGFTLNSCDSDAIGCLNSDSAGFALDSCDSDSIGCVEIIYVVLHCIQKKPCLFLNEFWM